MSNLYEITDGRVVLNLHPGQAEAWDSTARFIWVIAGSQGGKTSFAPWWLWREIMTRGAGDYLAVTASFDLFKLKLLPEMREVFEHVLGIGRYWAGDKVMEIRDPVTGKFRAKRADGSMYARIILRSAMAEGGLESATGKAAILDECGQDTFTVDSYYAVRARLALHRGRVLGTTTPYNLGWLYQIVQRRYTDPDSHVIQFASTINPNFSQEEFENLRITMPDWKFAMRYEGRFKRPAGMIYSDFIDEYAPDGHKIAPFEIPPHWPQIVGVDPGAVHCAILWLAQDPDTGIWYLHREALEGRLSTPEVAQSTRDVAIAHNWNVLSYQVGQPGEVQVRTDWQAAGVPNVRAPSVHDVESGIDRVIGLLRERRLRIFDSCVGTLDELGRYSRVLDASNQPTERIKDKETFHRLDALRYAAIGITTPRGVLVG